MFLRKDIKKERKIAFMCFINCVFVEPDYFEEHAAADAIILCRISICILTLYVEQNASVHRHHQCDVTRDADDSGIMMPSQDLKMSPAAPAGC